MFFSDKKSFYSFVVSALVKEANRENVSIIFNNMPPGMAKYDILLPDGLSILGKKRQKPYMIEIRHMSSGFDSAKMLFKNHLSKYPSIGTRFVILDSPSESLKGRGPNAIYLGRDFLMRLRKRNPEVYLNYLLGDDNLSIKQHSDSALFLSNDTGLVSDTKKAKAKKKIGYKIEKDDPDKLCEMNENDFKAFLNGESKASNCAVIIGNGVSIPFGSDNWSLMIKNLVDMLEPYYIEKHEHVENALSNSSYALSSFVKKTLTREESKEKYIEAIRYCVYRKYNEVMHNQKSMIKVLALAKEKYPTLPLLTYNYDTFIENQFKHQTNKELISVSKDFGEDEFDDAAKTSVFHLHGYIDCKKSENLEGDKIILTDEDYCDAYLNKKSWIRKMQLNVLQKYSCLFVGSSMSDLFQMSVIQDARKQDKDGKWNCFALMCLKDLEFKETMQIIKFYKEKGIRLIFVKSFEGLVDKLATLFGVNL